VIAFLIRFHETQYYKAPGHSEEFFMCDYSLEHLTSRPAKVGDKLVTTRFTHALTGGFCAVGKPDVAVCIMPGTEVAFEREIESLSPFWMRPKKLGSKVARFRRVNQGCQTMHHDALELPNGQIVLLTRLIEGQLATVIQLPATEHEYAATEHEVTEIVAAPPMPK
jgi:hypothetical protein